MNIESEDSEFLSAASYYFTRSWLPRNAHGMPKERQHKILGQLLQTFMENVLLHSNSNFIFYKKNSKIRSTTIFEER